MFCLVYNYVYVWLMLVYVFLIVIMIKNENNDDKFTLFVTTIFPKVSILVHNFRVKQLNILHNLLALQVQATVYPSYW